MLCLNVLSVVKVGDEALLKELWDRYEKAVDKICFQPSMLFFTMKP